jgi:integrase
MVYSQADITALVAAVGEFRCPLRAATMETLIGLLAVTGLRVPEVADVVPSEEDRGCRVALAARG